MNKVILIGRLTADPAVRQAGDTVVANYTLAVDRRFKREGEQTADFIRCVVFGKGAEFAEKWLTKGIKIAVTGRITTGSYTDRDGRKVYTTDVTVEEQEFAESKKAAAENTGGQEAAPVSKPAAKQKQEDDTGFMEIPNAVDEELPFM